MYDYWISIGPIHPDASRNDAHHWMLHSEPTEYTGQEIFALIKGHPRRKTIIEIVKIFQDYKYNSEED